MDITSTTRFLVPPLAALLLACGVPAHGKDSACEFKAVGLALAFGTLDPSNPIEVIKPVQAVNVGAGTVGDCSIAAGTMTVSVIGSTSRQLTNGAGGAIAYELRGFPLAMPQPGNKVYANFLSVDLTGRIAAGAYADAPAGIYWDTVTLSVTP
jgi:hypothetical protein